MGSLWSRSTDEVQQIDADDAQTYTYPSPSGSYFGSHFFMGGKKFDTVQPEAYLFGDNSDLNMLGPKPFNFPYHSPSGSEPVRALKCLVNIRKDTLRLIRVPNPMIKPEDVIQTNDAETQSVEEQPQGDPLYNLEFTFDTECPCSITVYYNAAEEMHNKVVTFVTKQKSGTMHYNAGCNQQFCATNHIINPTDLYLGERPKMWDFTKIPIAIQVSAECPDNQFHGHSHITYATLDKVSDDSWTIKPIKQKQAINGVCYLIQEIYGIENKNKVPTIDGEDQVSDPQDDDDDDSAECVVCLSDMRDTLILPCKHLCLCSTCANQLRFQQSGCPICRQSFRALLQIRAIRRKTPASSLTGTSSSITEETEQDDVQSVDTAADGNSDEAGLPFEISIPPGFEVVPLISAINGPVSSSTASLSTSRDLTRASSIVSTTSSLTRPRKNKSKTTIDIENEVTTRSPTDASHDFERKRSKGKRKSVKKKSIEKTSIETDQNQSASSDQSLASPDNRTDALEQTTVQCPESQHSDGDSEMVSTKDSSQVHQDLNPDKNEPTSPETPDIKDHEEHVYQELDEQGDFSKNKETEKVDLGEQHPLSVEDSLHTIDENQVVIEQVSSRTNSQNAEIVDTKV